MLGGPVLEQRLDSASFVGGLMARRRRSDGTTAGGHSAIDNGWFLPNAQAVVKVEDHARKLWKKIEGPADITQKEADRIMGRVEGMAIALAILKGEGYSAKGELQRIKHGRPGSAEERAGNG